MSISMLTVNCLVIDHSEEYETVVWALVQWQMLHDHVVNLLHCPRLPVTILEKCSGLGLLTLHFIKSNSLF